MPPSGSTHNTLITSNIRIILLVKENLPTAPSVPAWHTFGCHGTVVVSHLPENSGGLLSIPKSCAPTAQPPLAQVDRRPGWTAIEPQMRPERPRESMSVQASSRIVSGSFLYLWRANRNHAHAIPTPAGCFISSLFPSFPWCSNFAPEETPKETKGTKRRTGRTSYLVGVEPDRNTPNCPRSITILLPPGRFDRDLSSFPVATGHRRPYPRDAFLTCYLVYGSATPPDRAATYPPGRYPRAWQSG